MCVLPGGFQFGVDGEQWLLVLAELSVPPVKKGFEKTFIVGG